MSRDRVWSAPRCSKSEIKLSLREIEWKSLMNECLMGTDIFKKCGNEIEEFACVNPNSAMDLRHKMAKECTKMLATPPTQTQTEALKLLRLTNYNKMLKRKEGKMIEKEIARLKESLENNRYLIQEKLNEATKKRIKSSPNTSNCVKYYGKQWRKLELFEGVCEVDTWLSRSVRMTMETKINHQGIPYNVKVSLQRQDQEEESLEPTPTLDGSNITHEEKQSSFINEGKNEIMRRFFQKSTQESDAESNDLKMEEKICEILEIQKKMNLRIISHAWATWKVYIQQLKTRNKEKIIYKRKIETFLSKHKDIESKEGKRNLNGVNEKRVNFATVKTREKKTMNEEKEKQIKKLMAEVKTSQKEAYQKLREINKVNHREQSKNLEFLKRIQERREERLKRWKEIERKKTELEEERKRADKEREDEKRRKEEENKRKKLEESKEKLRLEMEKKKKRERDRERLRVNIQLAEDHYRRYLLRSYGVRPWVKLLEIGEALEHRAVDFYRTKLIRKVFDCITVYVREETRLKVSSANELHERILKKNCLRLWLEFHRERIKENQVASDWNEFRITERAFSRWMQFTQNEQLEYLDKKEVALLNYERKLKMKSLKKLRDYPELKKLEQAQENRKRKWRQRVKEILPDYQPAETCSAVFA